MPIRIRDGMVIATFSISRAFHCGSVRANSVLMKAASGPRPNHITKVMKNAIHEKCRVRIAGFFRSSRFRLAPLIDFSLLTAQGSLPPTGATRMPSPKSDSEIPQMPDQGADLRGQIAQKIHNGAHSPAFLHHSLTKMILLCHSKRTL